MDRNGILRNLAFTVAEVFKVQQRLDIDLMDLDSIIQSCTNPRTYMGLMFELSGMEGETFEEFCKAFDGDTMDKAQTALWEAIENFSPRDRQELIRKLVAKIRETEAEVLDRALNELTTKQSGS